MSLSIYLKLPVFVMVMLFISCTRQKTPPLVKQDPPVSLSDMIKCHTVTSWDSTGIVNRLSGEWQWEYIQCYWNPEDGNYDDYKTISLHFKTGNILELKENGQITQTSQWRLVNLNDGYWGIKTEPLVIYVTGRIMFCAERVLFSDFYTDGCNNYFKKVN